MGQALYRAHRPKKLSEVVGQEHVTTALARALKNNTVSHAYLLTGPRGVGKTTIARILAHEINNIPYDDESMHLDIIEIDAASNRRIEEIRNLRDKVHIAPTSAKYKVYIIDEVHMLTKEAFNALLKTLEEPPAHVIFILATTETHKLPETIISRTQRFAFKPVDLPKVVAHLQDIAVAEKITIADDALQLIAEHGEGSFRDSISLLDQIRNSGDKITLADVQTTLGIAPKELVEQLVAALVAHDAAAVATTLQAVHTGGHEPTQVAKQLGEALRAQLLSVKPALPSDASLALLAKLIEVPSSADPKSYLEIALLDTALAGQPASSPKIMQEAIQSKPPMLTEPHPSSLRRATVQEATTSNTPKLTSKQMQTTHAEEEKPAKASTVTLDKTVWPSVLAAIKAKHNTFFSIIRTAEPQFDQPGVITLISGFTFHQKRLNEQRNKTVLAEVIKTLTGQDVQIICIMGEPNTSESAGPPTLPPAGEKIHTVQAEPVSTPTVQNKTVEAISNIFGGAELLES